MRPADLALVAQIRAGLKDGSATAARAAAGITQAEAARSLKVSRQSVSQWESGESVPTDEHALAYARLLRSLTKAAA